MNDTLSSQLVEALERAIAELQVLQSIYGSSEDGEEHHGDRHDDATSSFRVVSSEALNKAKTLLADSVEADGGGNQIAIPTLDSVLEFPLLQQQEQDCSDRNASSNNNNNRCGCAILRICMPPGYPMSASATVSVEVANLTRSAQDELSKELNRYAKERFLLGEEAVLGIVQHLQEIVAEPLQQVIGVETDGSQSINTHEMDQAVTIKHDNYSRQWLFMDHIKAESRRAQMIRKASEWKLGGFIKPGYPGVCVVEGESHQVEEFVSWMKQIWIGRVAVRGEVTMSSRLDRGGDGPDDEWCRLPRQLVDLGVGISGSSKNNFPNMGALASACREAGLEEEFREYIMRIK